MKCHTIPGRFYFFLFFQRLCEILQQKDGTGHSCEDRIYKSMCKLETMTAIVMEMNHLYMMFYIVKLRPCALWSVKEMDDIIPSGVVYGTEHMLHGLFCIYSYIYNN